MQYDVGTLEGGTNYTSWLLERTTSSKTRLWKPVYFVTKTGSHFTPLFHLFSDRSSQQEPTAASSTPSPSAPRSPTPSPPHQPSPLSPSYPSTNPPSPPPSPPSPVLSPPSPAPTAPWAPTPSSRPATPARPPTSTGPAPSPCRAARTLLKALRSTAGARRSGSYPPSRPSSSSAITPSLRAPHSSRPVRLSRRSMGQPDSVRRFRTRRSRRAWRCVSSLERGVRRWWGGDVRRREGRGMRGTE